MSDSPSPARVVFLGGLGRSGTTLLERLLGEVPGIAPLGEVAHLWTRGVLANEDCGCARPFGTCPFWREVGARAFGGWSEDLAERVVTLGLRVDRTRRIPALARFLAGGRSSRRPAALGEYVAAHRRLYDAASEVAGCPVVVDSSKHASLAFCLAASGVDVHVVHVVRDPRAVAHSWHRRVIRPESGSPMTRWSPGRTSVHWLAQNLGIELLARGGVPVTRVRYEDLVRAPAETLGHLAARIGLPVGLDFLTGEKALLSRAHTVAGNPMRFAVGPIGLVPDDAWRTAAPVLHRSLVTALTWPLMIKYGYRGRLV
ncbi:sulfotransferase [Streptosporangium sp. NPDC000239]|uniref:sulfotransferase n=1 Tax=Streptosporangium sp. NPDC000239 TaxID=3154248 RepID=UPI003322520A